MVNYLRVEDLGMTEYSPILRTANGRILKVRALNHLEDFQALYNNAPSSFNQFISSIQEMGKRRISKQYIVKNEGPIKLIRRFLGPSTNIELDDKTRIENILTPCALPQTIVYGGEVMMDEDLVLSEEDFKTSKEKLDAASRYISEIVEIPVENPEDVKNLVHAAKSKLLVNGLSSALSEELKDFRNARDNTRFKRVADLKYSHRRESVEIDEKDYSKLKVSGFGTESVIDAFSSAPSFFVVLKGNIEDSIYKVRVNSERALKNISGIIEQDDVIDGVLDFMKQVNLKDCSDFIPLLLERGGVRVENVHTIAEAEETQTLEIGDKKIRTFDLTPKKSFVTLNNGSERKTVAAPTYIGVNFDLSMSDSLNVKIEDPTEVL